MNFENPRVITADLPVPNHQRYFEDFVPGAMAEYGAITLEEADIIAFARQYDPQDTHISPEKAARGPFQGLIASGWQTAAVMMRLYADHFVSKVANLGSPGIDELRWIRPVRPGDTLSIRCCILDAKRSRSKPDRGVVLTHIEVLNQNREVVMTVKSVGRVLCRKAL